MRRLRRFAALPCRTKLLFLEALAVLAGVRLGLAVLRYRRLRPILDGVRERPDRAGTFTARRVAWAVRRAARMIPRTTCLPQALAALVVMKRRGIEARLRLGVRAQQGSVGLDAHAWVESGGEVVLGEVEDLGEFSVLERAHGGDEGEAR